MEPIIVGLIWLLCIALVLGVVGWILGMIIDGAKLPPLVKQVVYAILGLVMLIFIIRFLMTLLSVGHAPF